LGILDLLGLLGLLGLLAVVYTAIRLWRRYTERERHHRRQVLDRWQAQPPNEHTATGENGTS
jgi:O-antigen ligase